MTFRVPVDPEYLQLVGRATYDFAYLEWQVVSVADKLSPGFVNTVGGLTAGQIASQFRDIIAKASVETATQARWKKLSETFSELVNRRNSFIHSNPITDTGGLQRLYSSDRKVWEDEDIVKLASDFEECAIDGKRHLLQNSCLAVRLCLRGAFSALFAKKQDSLISHLGVSQLSRPVRYAAL